MRDDRCIGRVRLSFILNSAGFAREESYDGSVYVRPYLEVEDKDGIGDRRALRYGIAVLAVGFAFLAAPGIGVTGTDRGIGGIYIGSSGRFFEREDKPVGLGATGLVIGMIDLVRAGVSILAGVQLAVSRIRPCVGGGAVEGSVRDMNDLIVFGDGDDIEGRIRLGGIMLIIDTGVGVGVSVELDADVRTEFIVQRDGVVVAPCR